MRFERWAGRFFKGLGLLVIAAPMLLFALGFTWLAFEHGRPDPEGWKTIILIWLAAIALVGLAWWITIAAYRAAKRYGSDNGYDRS